jgi:CO dehydrogenase nickel-insertion accessory protein CooC1
MKPRNPRRIAVTGGIGCGKSATGAALRALGVPVLDTDEVAHALLANDADAKAAIRERFGVGVFAGDAVDRKALGQVVFAEPGARKDLEAILHPRIQAQTDAWMVRRRLTCASAWRVRRPRSGHGCGNAAGATRRLTGATPPSCRWTKRSSEPMS